MGNKFYSIALIVGHDKESPGAKFCENSSHSHEYEYEYEFNREVAKVVAHHFLSVPEACVGVFFRNDIGLTGCLKEVVEWGADMSIELHCNAFNSHVKGKEAIVRFGDPDSLRAADSLLKHISNQPFRRIIEVRAQERNGKKERGAYNLNYLKGKVKISILIEPFFCDNPDDQMSVSRYSNDLINFIKEYSKDQLACNDLLLLEDLESPHEPF